MKSRILEKQKSRILEKKKRRNDENLKQEPLSWCIMTPTGKRKNIKGRDTSEVTAVTIRAVVIDPY